MLTSRTSSLPAALKTSGLCLIAVLALSGCSPPGQPGAASGRSGSIAPGGSASALSGAEYSALDTDQQYRVVNKLLATLYKGMPVDEFYDLQDGLVVSSAKDPEYDLQTLRTSLQTELEPEQRLALDREIDGDPDADLAADPDASAEPRYYFDERRPKQMPLARIHTYPVSRNAFSQWMAWHLANTILFSPAEEIDSADITDVQNLFRRLDLSIMNRSSIRQIVATHQRTVENWRRFRSPEDNTREMMEIYLGLFDRDDEVPRASIACQDLYLTDERDGYKLAYTDFPNHEPQLVLDTYVLNCGDFYEAVASHPLLIPRVVSVLVDYFFADRGTEERLALVESIAGANPVYFDDIFLAILFSRTYLLDTERPKSFEEAYLATAERLKWETHPDLFKGMTSGRGSLARTEMKEMGWPSMSLKLGRLTGVPLDSLSFANYHKAFRETLLLDRQRWAAALNLAKPPAPEPAPIEAPDENADARALAAHASALIDYEQALSALPAAERQDYDEALSEYQNALAGYRQIHGLSVAEFLDYLFLSTVQRRALPAERTALIRILEDRSHLDEEFNGAFVREDRLDDVGLIVFDYVSRLPETYYLPRI